MTNAFRSTWYKNPKSIIALGVLKHHCHCGRAIKHCLGGHEVCCERYHGTAFRDNNEDGKCEHCNRGYTTRQARLKEIAKQLSKIGDLTGESQAGKGIFAEPAGAVLPSGPPVPVDEPVDTPGIAQTSGVSTPNGKASSAKEKRAAKALEKAMKSAEKAKKGGLVTPAWLIQKVETILPEPERNQLLQDLDAVMRYKSSMSTAILTDEMMEALLEDPTAPVDSKAVENAIELLRPQKRVDSSEVRKLYSELTRLILSLFEADRGEEIETRKRRISYALWTQRGNVSMN
ncbi:hypothetical protein BT63DRAFT_452196 [Microthyrium microscopicum]|uniref:Uncharacterized protein n=1 Tax=Microthyrium microscopicum TaxID=703497 RepID=A0A6A6ULC1_9PEZI|nr:hypothetical protein BT63DRAFT_452196 [Microthyrium microscopicum]